ncbi:Protein LSM14-like protein RNA-associated protein of 55 kDa [Larimichthys crocea]|uniref:Protein LSM14-like protein RNA-associated protein of 55 kDa n=1 Tax=Larimichthys crocea TaxID=215358 RepID=A0A6G0HDF5_LARCR|nr:Protein LSM14-like protein RNA-associated protein of 55 kDa [Larimichthys crocea]
MDMCFGYALICCHGVCFLFIIRQLTFVVVLSVAGAPANRRGRGGGHRGRGRFNVRRDGPMKFEKDFDFERQRSVQQGGDRPRVPEQAQAQRESEKAVNGEDKATLAWRLRSEGNADDECDPLGPNCYYDKSKSFFDNISCDDTRKANEKSGGSAFPRERRQTWAEERRMNAETFGIPLRQGRGRGGYRGRGGMGFRGGRGRSASRGPSGHRREAAASGVDTEETRPDESSRDLSAYRKDNKVSA